MRGLFLGAGSVAAIFLAGFALQAERRPQFPVIVVLSENPRYQDFLQYAMSDGRETANPRAWGYLNRGVLGAVRYLESRGGFRANQVFSHALKGFAADLTADQIQRLMGDSMVSSIEPDGIATVAAQTLPWGVDRINGSRSSTISGNGSGVVTNVNVYIIDTGVAGHPDLNKVRHVTFVGGVNDDCHGHGTHVAGIVAAYDNDRDVVGVAPGAPITGVKVMNCNGSGSTSAVIKGVDWVTANAKAPAIANMSLVNKASDALDSAVRRSVAAGVFYAVAAGNDAQNACNISPARAGAGTDNGILAVAATNANNAAPNWTNYGPCVDLWAPGDMILSTYLGGTTAPTSGTSQASAHAIGTAGLYRSRYPFDSPAAIESALKSTAWSTGQLETRTSQPIRLVNAGAY